ncbi:MAG: T9SS type A sorting domain-containing protein [Bacteroidales bacterium]|nr:T9SS type A sorting domain-containing protein [Bacteroidales bacterium]
MRRNLVLFLVLSSPLIFAQDTPFRSIHVEESEYYRDHRVEACSIQPKRVSNTASGCTLKKIVFGYHTYWTGNAYLNYQWNLLSDLCYFSYEVDPATGMPVTIHEWLTDPAVDSAQANGVRTHLCATLFSGHGTFFSNPVSKQNLIDSLISLVQLRNGDGINLDFEAVPAAYGEEMVDFTIDLAQQYHSLNPDGIVSMALPSVDWSGIFNIDLLKEHIGIFFIMGYDYYWNGSAQAGPVAPLYSMTGIFNYNLSRTISYYLFEGVPLEKLILGMPYYGRQWPTESGSSPSNTTGNGTAYRYRTIKNSSGTNYTPENRQWEQHSFSTYYAFQENSNWYQCFLCETADLEYRYNIVNQRELGGIGMWALGYDDGYTELWQLIADHFTDCAILPCTDTIYDSGGPYWNYYNHEDYSVTLHSCDNTQIAISFKSFSLESGFDSLWVYDGADTNAQKIGAFSGNDLPSSIITTGSDLTLLFRSDAGQTMPGWMAVYESGYVFIEDEPSPSNASMVFPNPAQSRITISFPADVFSELSTSGGRFCLDIYTVNGQKMEEIQIPGGTRYQEIDVTGFHEGIYLLVLHGESGIVKREKFVIAR